MKVLIIEVPFVLPEKDKEAYKLLCQLYIKMNDYEMAQDVLDEMQEEIGVSGDFYYLSSVISNNNNEFVKYKENLEKAIENEDTLTFDKKSVLMELNNA